MGNLKIDATAFPVHSHLLHLFHEAGADSSLLLIAVDFDLLDTCMILAVYISYDKIYRQVVHHSDESNFNVEGGSTHHIAVFEI